MDDVFLKLMESTGVPAEARESTLAQLNALRIEYPGETPARLFARARKEGGAIPPSRCAHGVVHGECVACNSKVGERFYIRAGAGLVHTRPTCEAMGGVGPIEALRVRSEAGGETCGTCLASRPVRATRASSTASRSTRPSSPAPASRLAPRIVRPAVQMPQGPKPLDADTPPSVGDEVDWGGFTGVVTAVGEKGVTLDVEGVRLTAPWGDRARIRRQT